MKQIQGSERVKINEYVHAWSKFLFVSLLLFFDFFPQINHFYYLTSLQVENDRAHLRDIQLKTGRKIFHISAFPMYYSLNSWIGEYEMTKLIKTIIYTFASNPEKRTQNKHRKAWMKWNVKKWII